MRDTVGGLLDLRHGGGQLSVQKVEVRLDNGAWCRQTGPTTWNYSLNTSNFLNGSHTISARATEGGNDFSRQIR